MSNDPQATWPAGREPDDNTGFRIIPNEMWQEVSPTALMLWCKLDHLAWKSGEAWMSRENLAAALDRSASSIDRDRKILEAGGWIEKLGTKVGRSGAIAYRTRTKRWSNLVTSEEVSAKSRSNLTSRQEVSRSNLITSDAQMNTTANEDGTTCAGCDRGIVVVDGLPYRCNHSCRTEGAA
jgi:hypothetical protein